MSINEPTMRKNIIRLFDEVWPKMELAVIHRVFLSNENILIFEPNSIQVHTERGKGQNWTGRLESYQLRNGD